MLRRSVVSRVHTPTFLRATGCKISYSRTCSLRFCLCSPSVCFATFLLSGRSVRIHRAVSRPVLNRLKTMMSRTMALKFAVVLFAVVSSMAVAVNAQAASPAPAPESGVGALVPTVVAPAMALILAFVAGRMLW